MVTINYDNIQLWYTVRHTETIIACNYWDYLNLSM